MNNTPIPLEDRPVPPIQLHKKRLPSWAVGAIVAGVLAAAWAALCIYVSTLSTVFPNTVVLGVDLGGMTRAEAAEAWREADAAACYTVSFTDGERTVTTRTLQELGISVTPADAALSAYHCGRNGGAFQNTLAFVARLWRPAEVTPPYTVDADVLAAAVEDMHLTVENEVVDGGYELVEGGGLYLTRPRGGRQLDAEALSQAIYSAAETSVWSVPCTFVEKEGAPIDLEALHAELSGPVQESCCDKATGKPTASRVGVSFDVKTVAAQMEAADPGRRFLADAVVTFPKASQAFLEEHMFRDVLGSATTKVTGTATRINNVKLSAQAINGKIYNPGQEFWYNATVGQRTVAKGYGGAPSYVGGKTVDSVGGGICQTSSTLYLAQLNADLKTVLRYCHQFVPGYILWGCDATVSWGGVDYAFRNSTDYPIKIVTEWSKDNELTVSILGTKMDDTYVEMTNAVISSTPWQTRYVVNHDMAPGSKPVEVQTPYTGYYVKAYRNVYDGEGNLLSSRLESTSDYESRDRIYEVDYDTYVEMFGPPEA